MSERLTGEVLDAWAERLEHSGKGLTRSECILLLMECAALQIERAEARAVGRAFASLVYAAEPPGSPARRVVTQRYPWLERES